MLNCKISALGANTNCELTAAGVSRIAIANWSDTYTFTASGEDCEIDTISLGDENFFELPFAEGSGLAEAVVNAGAFTDQKSVLHRVTFVLNNLDCDIANQWKNFLLARVMFAVRTKMGQVLLFGVNNGMSAVNFDYSSGTAETDQMGINAVYEGAQLGTPLIVKDWATIAALFPEDDEEGSDNG